MRSLRGAPATANVILSTLVGVGIATGTTIGIASALLPLGLLLLYSAWFLPLAITALGIAPAFAGQYTTVATLFTLGLAARLAVQRVAISESGIVIACLVASATLSGLWTDSTSTEYIVALAPTLVLLLGCLAWPVSQRQVVRYLVYAGVIHAILAILQFVHTADRVTEFGPYALPTMVVGGTAAVGAAFVMLGQRVRYIVAALIILVGIAATETRGMVLGWVIGVLALPAFLAFDFGKPTTLALRLKRRRLILYGVVELIATGLAVVYVLQRESGRFSGASVYTGGQGRWDELVAGLQEISRSPVYGHGVGHIFSNPIAGIYDAQDVNYVHNSLVYFGIAGGILLMCLYVYSLVHVGRSSMRRDLDGSGRVLACCLVGLVTYSLTAAIQRSLHFNLFIAVVAAAGHGLGRPKGRTSLAAQAETSR